MKCPICEIEGEDCSNYDAVSRTHKVCPSCSNPLKPTGRCTGNHCENGENHAVRIDSKPMLPPEVPETPTPPIGRYVKRFDKREKSQ